MQTLRSMYWDSIRPIKFLTMLLYPLAALGMWLDNRDVHGDQHLLFEIAPWWAWSLGLTYIFIARFVGIFFWEGLTVTRRTTPILGVFFWSMMLASNLQHPETLAFGTLYGVAALLEGWILSRAWMEP